MKRTIAILLLLATAACAATKESTLRKNKEVARRAFAEILEKGRFEVVPELYAPDFRNGRATLEEDMAALRAIKAASPPDATMRPELLVAEDDYVAVLWRAGATIDGRSQSMRGITIWKIVDGKIREEWSEFDEAGMKRSLGLVDGGAAAR